MSAGGSPRPRHRCRERLAGPADSTPGGVRTRADSPEQLHSSAPGRLRTHLTDWRPPVSGWAPPTPAQMPGEAGGTSGQRTRGSEPKLPRPSNSRLGPFQRLVAFGRATYLTVWRPHVSGWAPTTLTQMPGEAGRTSGQHTKGSEPGLTRPSNCLSGPSRRLVVFGGATYLTERRPPVSGWAPTTLAQMPGEAGRTSGQHTRGSEPGLTRPSNCLRAIPAPGRIRRRDLPHRLAALSHRVGPQDPSPCLAGRRIRVEPVGKPWHQVSPKRIAAGTCGLLPAQRLSLGVPGGQDNTCRVIPHRLFGLHTAETRGAGWWCARLRPPRRTEVRPVGLG